MKKMKFKKTACLVMAALISVSALAGCGQKKMEEGKIGITIGTWPYDTETGLLEVRERLLEMYKQKRPDVEVIKDTYHYDTKTYTVKASAKQLPDVYTTWYTEFDKIVDAGYAADLTEEFKARGWDKDMNPDILATVTDDDGKIRAVPGNAYIQGVSYNKDLFIKAGLVNEDGTIKFPQTYEQLAEYAKIIKDKTGVAGFAIPTTGNYGGWHFMNIAWSYGVEFMKQDKDGKWIATFDSPEAIAALTYIKDLKWKYNVLPDISVIDNDELYRLWCTDKVAIIITSDPSAATSKYGMDVKKVAQSRMLEGPAGRYSQMGGDLSIIDSNATEEQIKACLDWLEITGVSAVVDDSEEHIATMQKSYERSVANNNIVLGRRALPVWTNEEVLAFQAKVAEPYINVDLKDFEDYLNNENVILKAEEPVCCQELYAVLDNCIQEVITNPDADPAEIIKVANNDFQLNHLDKQ